MESFEYVRKRDINLALAIGSETKDIPFYSWGSLNLFNTADPNPQLSSVIRKTNKNDLLMLIILRIELNSLKA